MYEAATGLAVLEARITRVAIDVGDQCLHTTLGFFGIGGSLEKCYSAAARA